MKIIKDIEQGSPEWFECRVASIGGSAINEVAASGGKMRAGRLDIMAGELLSGVKHKGRWFKDADRGHKYEPVAIAAYEALKMVEVERVGVVLHDLPHRHYSPDGLLPDRIVEVKTRHPNTFQNAVIDGHFPMNERRQIQWGLWVCEKDRCDRIQYCPEMENRGERSLWVEAIYRDEKMIKDLTSAADRFIRDAIKRAEAFRKR